MRRVCITVSCYCTSAEHHSHRPPFLTPPSANAALQRRFEEYWRNFNAERSERSPPPPLRQSAKNVSNTAAFFGGPASDHLGLSSYFLTPPPPEFELLSQHGSLKIIQRRRYSFLGGSGSSLVDEVGASFKDEGL